MLQGVENVYTQHQPLLFQIMESIVKGRLRDVDYPFIGNHFQQGRFVAIKYKLFIVILWSSWGLMVYIEICDATTLLPVSRCPLSSYNWNNLSCDVDDCMKTRPQDVIIFIVGGTTYEESRSVALQNATNTGIRFILGGSSVLNSKRYD